MFKWLSWLIRMGATALLLSFLCIWTTGYIVNSYMETVVKQLDLPLETQPFALSGVWGKLWGAEEPSQKAAVIEDKLEDKQTAEAESEGAEQQPDSVNGSRESDQANASPAAEPLVPSSSDEAVKPDQDGAEAEAAPAFHDADGTKQLTDEQRQRLYAMVVSKLNSEQLKLLSDSLQGGLTSEERNQLQEMLKQALTAEEYTEMTNLLQGLSHTDPKI